MIEPPYPWRPNAGCIKLYIVLTPKSSRDSLEGIVSVGGRDGVWQSALKVKVRAQPQDGAANRAMIKFLSKAFSIPKSDISCIAGAKSRHKTIQIDGNVSENLKKIQYAVLPHKTGLD